MQAKEQVEEEEEEDGEDADVEAGKEFEDAPMAEPSEDSSFTLANYLFLFACIGGAAYLYKRLRPPQKRTRFLNA